MKNVVVTSTARTPIGGFLGSLSTLSAPKLGAHAIASAIERSSINKDLIDEVIMGQVLQGGVGQAPARQASIYAGLSPAIPCTTVNKVCGSGLKAVMMARDGIMLGDANAIVAGGMESMSNAPYFFKNARQGFRMGDQTAFDLMIHDGLFDPYGQAHMGSFGDLCAREHKFSREEQDQFAHASYQRAQAAAAAGYSKNEIAPVIITEKNGATREVALDEEPARYQPEKMATLRPVFSKDGTVTAANASKINDGAAAVVVASEDFARDNKLPIKARIVGQATHATDPQWFTVAPIGAIKKILMHAKLDVSDIDLFEINEAFSVVTLVAMRELKLPHERVNIFGGAIALGHPIGCSGARLLGSLLNALEIKQKRYGCVSLCLGGGEAVAMIVERVES